MRAEDLKKKIREIPDFPKPGINFYDLSTLFRDAEAFGVAVGKMVERYRGVAVDAVAGIEARGLILASAMAHQLGTGLILVRKAGKLPGDTIGESYSLEYGESCLEVHKDALEPGQRVVIIDDLLATGGTAGATGRLMRKLGGIVDSFAFLVELEALHGRRQLESENVFTLIKYES